MADEKPRTTAELDVVDALERLLAPTGRYLTGVILITYRDDSGKIRMGRGFAIGTGADLSDCGQAVVMTLEELPAMASLIQGQIDAMLGKQTKN